MACQIIFLEATQHFKSNGFLRNAAAWRGAAVKQGILASIQFKELRIRTSESQFCSWFAEWIWKLQLWTRSLILDFNPPNLWRCLKSRFRFHIYRYIEPDQNPAFEHIARVQVFDCQSHTFWTLSHLYLGLFIPTVWKDCPVVTVVAWVFGKPGSGPCSTRRFLHDHRINPIVFLCFSCHL